MIMTTRLLMLYGFLACVISASDAVSRLFGTADPWNLDMLGKVIMFFALIGWCWSGYIFFKLWLHKPK